MQRGRAEEAGREAAGAHRVHGARGHGPGDHAGGADQRDEEGAGERLGKRQCIFVVCLGRHEDLLLGGKGPKVRHTASGGIRFWLQP